MSIEDPYPSERVHDPQFGVLVEHLCSRPGMYVHPPTVDTVCAFIDGFDAGRHGVLLLGFQQWLVVRTNGGNNLHWSALAKRVLSAESASEADQGDERHQIRDMGRLIAEYLRYRDENGITKVFYDYGRWLLRKRWYQGPLRKK
jgi:hypothetical protein